MNEEELKLLNKLDDLPNKLNLEIRGLILAEVMLRKENQELKKQLKYLRSGEYLNQLKFERNMLQDVVDAMEVAPEDKAFIDCTHRNTELLAQQKEFIEYLENEINMCDGFLETIKSDLEELTYAGRVAGKTYITTQIMKNETAKKICEEILSKYKEIIGKYE